jgi:hypothetical protein
MSDPIHTYSIVKALYDRGRDYIDAFWPFVLEVAPKDKRFSTTDQIQRRLKDRFGLNIPLHAVETIARRAKKNKYLSRRDREYAITDAGIEFISALETERDVERRINELVEDACRYLAKERLECTSTVIT